MTGIILIEGIELSVLLKDTIKMNAVKAFVPRANNADASVSERGPELFQTVIILKRNFIISEEPLQTQRLCSEQSEQPRHPKRLELREYLAEIHLLADKTQCVIDCHRSAANLSDRAVRRSVAQLCDGRVILTADIILQTGEQVFVVLISFVLCHICKKEFVMKKILIGCFISLTLLFSTVTAFAASPDEAVMIAQQDDLTPLYTTAPDSSLRDYANYMTVDRGILFYTQTTALALVAGYLILFKVKGIPHSEKMHRRWRNKNK